MNQWTEEDVAKALVATFHTHADDIDPAVAHRIALTTPPTPRRLWGTAASAASAVAVILLIAALSMYAHHNPSAQQTPDATQSTAAADPQPTQTTPTDTSAGNQNRADAMRAAEQVLAAVPVPPGSTPDTALKTTLSHPGCECGEVDPTLTRTRWWTVPLSYPDLLTWYQTHTPARTGGSYYDIAQTRPSPRGEFDWSSGESAKAYSTPEIVMSYRSLDSTTTALRVDVTLAARYERPAETLAPPSVTSIEVTRSTLGAGSAPSDLDETITSPATIAALVSAFNDLAGAYRHEGQGCGSPVGTTYLYAVTFKWPGHTLVNSVGAPLCGEGRGLTLDGTSLPETLDDSPTFDQTAAQALGTSNPPTQ